MLPYVLGALATIVLLLISWVVLEQIVHLAKTVFPKVRNFASLLLVLVSFICWIVMYAALWLPLQLSTQIEKRRYSAPLHPGKGYQMNLLMWICEVPLSALSFFINRYISRERKRLQQSLSASEEAKTHEDKARGIWYSPFEEDDAQCGGQLNIGALWATLFNSPRWNTHGGSHLVICDLPDGSGVLEVENLQTPGVWWRILVCDNDGEDLKTIAPSASSGSTLSVPVELPARDVSASSPAAAMDDDENEEVHKAVKAKQLKIYIHHYYFDGCDKASLPAIRLQDTEIAARADCELSQLDFIEKLRERQNVFMLAHQWYVFFMLSQRHLLSSTFIDEDMMGKKCPTMATMHGVVLQGMSLVCEASATFLKDHLVFVTVYSRASLPIIGGFRMKEPLERIHPSAEDGFWQLRAVRRDAGSVEQDITKDVFVKMERPCDGALSSNETKQD